MESAKQTVREIRAARSERYVSILDLMESAKQTGKINIPQERFGAVSILDLMESAKQTRTQYHNVFHTF